jgi:hypothetical protein
VPAGSAVLAILVRDQRPLAVARSEMMAIVAWCRFVPTTFFAQGVILRTPGQIAYHSNRLPIDGDLLGHLGVAGLAGYR